MYVCTCACMHVCMYVCMYACMYLFTYLLVYSCMYLRIHLCVRVCVWKLLVACSSNHVSICSKTCSGCQGIEWSWHQGRPSLFAVIWKRDAVFTYLPGWLWSPVIPRGCFMSIKVSWLSVCCNGVELSQEPPVLVALDNTDLGLEISFFNCRYFRMISQVLIAQGIDSYNVASLHYLSSYNFWNMIYIYIARCILVISPLNHQLKFRNFITAHPLEASRTPSWGGPAEWWQPTCSTTGETWETCWFILHLLGISSG